MKTHTATVRISPTHHPPPESSKHPFIDREGNLGRGRECWLSAPKLPDTVIKQRRQTNTGGAHADHHWDALSRSSFFFYSIYFLRESATLIIVLIHCELFSLLLLVLSYLYNCFLFSSLNVLILSHLFLSLYLSICHSLKLLCPLKEFTNGHDFRSHQRCHSIVDY